MNDLNALIYQVVDTRTGKVLGIYTYATRKRAYARIDRLDNAYGAVRYVVTVINPNAKAA